MISELFDILWELIRKLFGRSKEEEKVEET
jgi:hypothetical protein